MPLPIIVSWAARNKCLRVAGTGTDKSVANQADSPVMHDARNFTVDKSLAKEPASVIFISTANISGFEPETGGETVLHWSINIHPVITGVE